MSEDRGDRMRRPRGRKQRRKVCTFCVDKIQHIDYKDVLRLRRLPVLAGRLVVEMFEDMAPAAARHLINR